MGVILAGLAGLQLFGQNWTTHCGGNERNGLSELPGPQAVTTPEWTVTDAFPTALGMNIYSFGDRFVTSRVDFSPYTALIECRDLTTGELLWMQPGLSPGSIMYAMGFNEDAVYAHDYGTGSFYALRPSDGSIMWEHINSYTFGPMDGVIYTCDRNVIINGALGSVDESTVCLDRSTGEVVWANSNWFAITPNETKAAHGDRLYLITGAINQPKQLTVVDIRSGESLYSSEELPGDGDQEGPVAVGPDGGIFFRRDGGDLYAMDDNGSGFSVRWTYTPVNMGLLLMNYSFDYDGNLLFLDNGKVYRLDREDGTPLDSSLVSGLSDGRIVMGSDSVVYINNTAGVYTALSYDLQTTRWSMNVNGNYYAGPSLSKEGRMVVCGAGSTIRCYRYTGNHAPVGDFAASDYRISANTYVHFTDQSSFQPDSWQWEFSGGTPAVSYDQNPQFILYENPGVYDVILIVSNAYGSDTVVKRCLIEAELFAGAGAGERSDGLCIFPNPALDRVQINSDVECTVTVTSSAGIEVYRDDRMRRERVLDVSGWPVGVYFVIFLEGEGEAPWSSCVEKLIIFGF